MSDQMIKISACVYMCKFYWNFLNANVLHLRDNSFKSDTLNTSSIISWQWMNQQVKQQAPLWWVLPRDTAQPSQQGSPNSAVPQNHTESFLKTYEF